MRQYAADIYAERGSPGGETECNAWPSCHSPVEKPLPFGQKEWKSGTEL